MQQIKSALSSAEETNIYVDVEGPHRIDVVRGMPRRGDRAVQPVKNISHKQICIFIMSIFGR